jgi:tRNA(Arg) A34 adenosine deaminase TadA
VSNSRTAPTGTRPRALGAKPADPAPGVLASSAPATEPRIEPTPEQVLAMLERAHALAQRAVLAGHHPFGAVLMAADHETVLLEQGNVDSVNHAEAVLARAAAARYAPAELWPCTLVTTVEPCAMCAGTQYWANIGRVVYGIEERTLLAMTGNHAENPTLDLPCRHVFARGQKEVRVIGPVPAMAEPIAQMQRRYGRSR